VVRLDLPVLAALDLSNLQLPCPNRVREHGRRSRFQPHVFLPRCLPPRTPALIRRLAFVTSVLLGSCASAAADQAVALDLTLTVGERRELQREGRLIVDLLQNLNYSERQFHQIEGKEIIDAYVAALDPDKLLLTADEIRFLHQRFDRSLKSVYLMKGEFQPAIEIFATVRDRAKERVAWTSKQLESPLDLTQDSKYVVHYDTAPVDQAECDRRWTLRLKYAVIGELLRGRTMADAVREVRKSHLRWAKQLTEVDAFQVRARFLEALINLFDPHSGYFSPQHAEAFQTMMKGAVPGVGLVVEREEDVWRISQVLASGPADEQGSLQVGDELLALADGAAEWTQIADKRLEQVSAMLRGNPGTGLRIAYRPEGSTERKEIELVRRETVLIEQRAWGAVSDVPTSEGKRQKLGLIELPDFYTAGTGATISSATHDVRELIEQMKTKGIEGLVLDLRRNPGGAMLEAVALSGLFIPAGPVVLTRANDGVVTTQAVSPSTPVWDGPLVVLIARESASASELFAGAMRFHRRAVIAGAPRTYGKGTAQNYIDLNLSPMHGSGTKLEWGTLRVTQQRFYFPDGNSPQRVGATADVIFDSTEFPGTQYEEDLPHALPTDSIVVVDAQPAAGQFARVDPAGLDSLRATSAKRQDTMPEFALRKRRQELRARSAGQKEFSLELEDRLKEREAADAEIAGFNREFRELAPHILFTSERHETARVSEALAQHVGFTRRHVPEGVDLRHGSLRGGRFLLESPTGALIEVPLDHIEFNRYGSDAAELAEAFGRASDFILPVKEFTAAMSEVSLANDLTAFTIVDAFRRKIGGDADAGKVRSGVEAVLHRMVELDPWLAGIRRTPDLGAREGMRIAADWAASIAGSAAASHVTEAQAH
jgi:carboxyl-terminal processing protease